jgi:type II secretory pathway component PulF
MKKFRYKAKKGPREVVEGVLQAESLDLAMDKIHEMGLIAVDLKEEKGSGDPRFSLEGGRKIKARELCQFYRQFASLIKAGVPVIRALSFLARESTLPALQEVVLGLEASVRGGQSLQEAFSKYPKVFSQLDRGMIQTGESGGKIEEALLKIAQYRTGQEVLRMKVKTALAYPLFVLTVGVCGVLYLLASVVPQFAGFFSSLGQKLPLPTRILIAVSSAMKWGWIPLVLLTALAVVAARRILAKPSARAAWDAWILRLPVVGPILMKSEIATLARSLSLLVRSGIPLLSAIRAVSPVLGNLALRQEIEKVYRGIEQGGLLSRGLEAARLFPAFFIQIVSVGEEAGKLDEALNEVADWYELETAESIQIMTGLLEPAMILVVAVVMGAMMISILLPIFSMSTMIN